MLRHACGYALANKGHDTRAIQAWLGCPEGRQTFSLLPDFLAARLPGLLDMIQTWIAVVQSARSMEAAADLVRGPEVTLSGAIRWLRLPAVRNWVRSDAERGQIIADFEA
jgi:hypothetical protein